MLSLSHTLISLPFGIYLQNPIIIFLAAFVFHLFADTLLHWNIYLDEKPTPPTYTVAIDIVSGLVIAGLFLSGQLFTIPILAAIAGGNMPDILDGFWEIFGKKNQKKYLPWLAPCFDFHDKLQLETKHVLSGLIPQLILITTAILLIV